MTAEGRLEALRGRYAFAGHPSLRGVSLSAFCDAVWLEILDDVSPMGDRGQFRQIVRELFLEGKPAHEIYYTDAKGKRRRLTDVPSEQGKPVPKDALEEARALREQIRQQRQQAQPEQAD